MAVGDKIKEAREALGLKQSDFAEAIGVFQNDVSRIERGEKKFVPNSYIQFLYKKGFDVNSIFDDSMPLQKLGNEVSMVQEPAAEFVLRTDKRLKNQIIPIFNLEARAGLVELFRDFVEFTPVDYMSIPNLPKCDGAIYVTGDSMYPLLKSGDIVAFKRVANIPEDVFWGEMYVISVEMDGDEYVSIKYIQKSELGGQFIKLVSQNAHHQPKDVDLSRVRALAIVKASVRINSMR